MTRPPKDIPLHLECRRQDVCREGLDFKPDALDCFKAGAGNCDELAERPGTSIDLPVQAVLLGQHLKFVQDVLSYLGVVQELLYAGQVGRLDVFTQNFLDVL